MTHLCAIHAVFNRLEVQNAESRSGGAGGEEAVFSTVMRPCDCVFIEEEEEEEEDLFNRGEQT